MSVGSIVSAIEGDVAGALEAAWSAIKTKLEGLGATVLGQCATAAGVLLQNGFSATSLAEAVASVSAALPADVVAAEADLSAAVVTFFQQLAADAASGVPSSGG